MKPAILILTCGRVTHTARTWENNLSNMGCEADLYWWDNTQNESERSELLALAANYQFKQAWHALQNSGISIPFNLMMGVVFENEADFIVTMANDIIEPDGWVKERVETARDIHNAGVVAIPPAGADVKRYDRKNMCGHVVETGLVIGNWLIRKELYEAIGGFTLDFGNYGPIDLDYCFRAWHAGFETMYISDIKSLHIGEKDCSEYQKNKDELLEKAWSIYHANIKAYRNGTKSIKQ